MITPIRTMIVDDEPSCIKSLSNDLEHYPEIELIATARSADKAKTLILHHQPSLLFLDIEMPKMNGIELLREIHPHVHPNMSIVFYTAFDKYMIDALRASVFDFLQKPYLPGELKLIITRVKDRMEKGQPDLRTALSGFVGNDPKQFALYTPTGLLLVQLSKVLQLKYLKDVRCWQVTLTDLSVHKLRSSTTAKDILHISKSLVQISQDHILNINYLVSVENNTYRCLLYPPFSHLDIHASRRYYTELKERLEIL